MVPVIEPGGERGDQYQSCAEQAWQTGRGNEFLAMLESVRGQCGINPIGDNLDGRVAAFCDDDPRRWYALPVTLVVMVLVLDDVCRRRLILALHGREPTSTGTQPARHGNNSGRACGGVPGIRPPDDLVGCWYFSVTGRLILPRLPRGGKPRGACGQGC
jgi:hypothetical protein